MVKNKLFTILTMGSVAATLSCSDASAPSSGGGLTDDCPIGMFRPVGLDNCVFSATDSNGNQITLPDDRCAEGQPAFPPTCVSTTGLRAYLADATTCTPNYQYEPGSCERNSGTSGVSGGTAGFGAAGAFFGTAGALGSAGFDGTAGASGFGGDFGLAGAPAGDAGASGTAGEGTAGVSGTAGEGTAGATTTTDAGATDALSVE